MCEKCPYLEFFWSVFSGIWTEHGKILLISPYLAEMRENVDQKNYEYGHFSCSGQEKFSLLTGKNALQNIRAK